MSLRSWLVLLFVSCSALALSLQSHAGKPVGLAKILGSGEVVVCVRSDIPPFGYYVKWDLRGQDIQRAKRIVQHIDAIESRDGFTGRLH